MKLYGICRQKGKCVCRLCARIERPDIRQQERSSRAGSLPKSRPMTVSELSDYLAEHGQPPKNYRVELD